jgi:hypothetical protein
MGNRNEPLCYLDDLLADVEDAVLSGDMTNIAGVALDLAACNSAILEKLEPLKIQLRDHARTMVDSIPGTIRIPGDMGGVVTVTFPSEQLKLAKGADIEELKGVMGETFDSFFDTKVSYKPKSKTPWMKMADSFTGSPELMHDLMGAIEVVEPTPRVGFKP